MGLEVGPNDIDELGHVNNAAYIAYVEKIARAHAESVGLSTFSMQQMGRAFVVRKLEATYFREARLNDDLTLETWVEEFRGAQCTRHVEIFHEGGKVFESKTDWVWIDTTTRSPKRVPLSVKQQFIGRKDLSSSY